MKQSQTISSCALSGLWPMECNSAGQLQRRRGSSWKQHEGSRPTQLPFYSWWTEETNMPCWSDCSNIGMSMMNFGHWRNLSAHYHCAAVAGENFLTTILRWPHRPSSSTKMQFSMAWSIPSSSIPEYWHSRLPTHQVLAIAALSVLL